MKATLCTVTRRYMMRPTIIVRPFSATSTRFDGEKAMIRHTKGSANIPESAAQRRQRLHFSTNTKEEKPHMERELQGGLNAEQLLVLDEMFGKIEFLETEVKALRKKVQDLDPTFAVDAPDGESLGHELEEKLEVQHIIEEAALHGDKEAVEKDHKLKKQVEKFHAKDPEHDW